MDRSTIYDYKRFVIINDRQMALNEYF